MGRELRLSDLDSLLGTGPEPLTIHLCFAGASSLTEWEVAQGAVIAEALALRAQTVPVMVTYGPRLAAARCNVLVGTVDQVKEFLSVDDVQKIQRSAIALRPLPGSARRRRAPPRSMPAAALRWML